MNQRILLLLFLLLSSGRLCAQKMTKADIDKLPVVPPDQAANSLISDGQPQYPPDAQAARIMGVVRMAMVVDETGRVRDVFLIHGHPMLAPAAMRTVKLWKYKPFQIEGRPAVVRTEVDIGFPEGIEREYAAREKEFQGKYWSDMRVAQDAAKGEDWLTAEARLKAARAAAQERGEEKWLELANVLSMLGSVKANQNDLGAAEQFYKQSLDIHQKHQRADEAEVAAAEEDLATVYYSDRKFEKAEPLLLQSVKRL